MNFIRSLSALTSLLAVLVGMYQPLAAAKLKHEKHKHSSSSSDQHKKKSCCDKTRDLLCKINRNTENDLAIDTQTFGLVNQINQTTQTDLAIDRQILTAVNAIDSVISCGAAVQIVPQDFMDSDGNLSQTYVINTPGEYQLCSDIVFDPVDTDIPAIWIQDAAIGNVTVNLNGKTLSQVDKTIFGINGIQVDPGLINITIKNGSVTGFSNFGIQCGDPTDTDSSTITNLQLADLYVTFCAIQDTSFIYTVQTGVSGVIVVNAQDILMENCNINENAGAGFRAANVVKLTINNSHFDDNTWANQQFGAITPNPSINGAYSSGCFIANFAFAYDGTTRDIHISNSTFDRNNSEGNCAGLGVSYATNVSINSCTANDTSVTLTNENVVLAINNGTGPLGSLQCRGILIVAENVTINNCQATSSSLTLEIPVATPSTALDFQNALVGIIVQNPSSNASITNCEVGLNTFTNNTNVGIKLVNQGIAAFSTDQLYVGNCQAFGNTNGPSANRSQLVVIGMDLASIDNLLVENCVSSGHSQSAQNPFRPNAQYSFAAGFKASFYNSGSTIFKNCTASGNIDTGATSGNGGAYGFTTRDPNNPGDLNSTFVFDSCIAESNTTALGTGIGFDMFNIAGSKVINCLAEANNYGIELTDFEIVSTTVLPPSVGLSLPQSTITVAGTLGFPTNPNAIPGQILGTIIVSTTNGPQTVTYTGMTSTSFTGCKGGYGTMSAGAQAVSASCFNNIFSNNILEANTKFGIKDTGGLTYARTNAYYKNQAKNNGASPTGNPAGSGSPSDTNFSGGNLGTGAPIRLWVLPGLPHTTDNNGILDPLDNISIN